MRDVAQLRDRLAEWLPAGTDLREVVALSTGHSNETYRLEGLGQILRMPPSQEGLLPPYDMAAQHALLDRLSRVEAGPPVPRVGALCLDPEVLGAPFFLMECAPGTSYDHPDVPDWVLAATPQVRDEMCRQWVDAIVAVTRVPISEMIGVPHHDAAQEAAHWLTVARQAQAPAALLDVLQDLTDCPPKASGPVTAVHGDTRHANCLWENGVLTAFVDWELARVADPLLDLANTLCYFPDGQVPLTTAGFDLPGWWDRRQVVQAWEAGTGRVAVDLPRWEGLAMAKLAAVLAVGADLLTRGLSSDPRFAVWRDTLPQYVELIRFRMSLPV